MGCGDVVCPPGIVAFDSFCYKMDECAFAAGKHHHYAGFSIKFEQIIQHYTLSFIAYNVCYFGIIALKKLKFIKGRGMEYIVGLACMTPAFIGQEKFPKHRTFTYGMLDYDKVIGTSLAPWHQHFWGSGWLAPPEDLEPCGRGAPIHLLTWKE